MWENNYLIYAIKLSKYFNIFGDMVFFQCLQFILLIILVTDLVLLKMSSLSELFLSSLNCAKNTSHANCPLKFVSEQ